MIKNAVQRSKHEYLNNQTFVRSNFNGENIYDFALLSPIYASDPNMQFIPFTDTKNYDFQNSNKTVHFFIEDARFECVYKNPDKYLERLAVYNCLLTPDFSVLADMPAWLQIENVGKSRWCGRYWQEKGLRVLPTVSWGDPASLEFSFLGLPEGTSVAISTIGTRNPDASVNFLLGYQELIHTVKPYSIYCYGKPFNEMYNMGSIIYTIEHSTYNRRES